MIVALTTLNIIDLLLTLAILKRGGRELNPVESWFMRELGNAPGMLVAKFLAILIVVLMPLWVMKAVCAGLVLVCLWNAKVLHGLER